VLDLTEPEALNAQATGVADWGGGSVVTADVRQLTELAGVLNFNASRAGRDMRAVVERGALNVKNGWRDNARSTAGRHARLYPYSIGYDVRPVPGGATAEVGPDKDRPQGPLGNILEFGTSTQAGHNDGGRALAEEAPRFAEQVEAIADNWGQL
jgi:hypothetical protein